MGRSLDITIPEPQGSWKCDFNKELMSDFRSAASSIIIVYNVEVSQALVLRILLRLTMSHQLEIYIYQAFLHSHGRGHEVRTPVKHVQHLQE